MDENTENTENTEVTEPGEGEDEGGEQEVSVAESILKTVRQMIGPSAAYDVFDLDLIISINAAFSRLCQLGVGPEIPYRITDVNNTWNEFIADGFQEEVKQYIYLKTKMIFDPPASGTVAKSYEEQINMLEWTMKEVSRFGY